MRRVLEDFVEEYDRAAAQKMPAPKSKVAGTRFVIRPDLVSVLTKEPDKFTMELKQRVMGYFSNPAVVASHRDSLDCCYWRNAKDFLKKRHGSGSDAVEAYKQKIVPEEDCGCPHNKKWLPEKKCAMKKILSQFMAEHE